MKLRTTNNQNILLSAFVPRLCRISPPLNSRGPIESISHRLPLLVQLD
jgi:hypothetical protein